MINGVKQIKIVNGERLSMKPENMNFKAYNSLREKENPTLKTWRDNRDVHTNRPKSSN